MCGDRGAVVLVHLDPAAAVGGQPGGLQVQVRRSCPGGPPSTSRCRPGSACRSPGWPSRRRGGPPPAATVSPNRNVTARSRRWYLSASTTSRSQNSSIRSRCSTTVTLVPSAANIEAYSMPITPAPTTTIDRGTCSRCWMPSESMTVRSSNATLAGRAGRVPVAMTMFSARDRPDPAGAVVDLQRCAGRRTGAVPVQDRDPVAGQLAADDVDLAADHVLGRGPPGRAMVISSLTR